MDKNRCFLDSRSWTEAAQVLSVTPVSELQQGKVKDLFYNCKFWGLSKRMLSVISSDKVGESDKIVPLFITYRVVGHSPSG